MFRFCSEPSNAIRSVNRFTTIVNISRMRRRSRILSDGGTTRYSEIGPLIVHQIVDGEVAGRRVPSDKRIAI